MKIFCEFLTRLFNLIALVCLIILVLQIMGKIP